ncbi:MAG: rRNA maturation RNase YbeY [Candidatus Marinimicrobia bacterium]|nr:rRNA maturation RNase YbeY [Candidatus Neomarinimicrobiota bacterium]|tara:strand:+ start:4145 stop:4585 length:441 start_codon:yes stop_codon:yes gene_type:complete
MIKVSVEVADDQLPINDGAVKQLAIKVLTEEGQSEGELTIIFAHDELLRQMKITYFDQDVYTDVVSFRLDEESEPFEGEIYISSARAEENAEKVDEPVSQELARLVCHGCLHLIGHEDQSENGKSAMRVKEDWHLEKFQPEFILNR